MIKKRFILRYISQKNRRSTTFSKRKKGIMKKAHKISLLTGSQVLLLIVGESGHLHAFSTPKLKPIVTEHECLIKKYLSASELQESPDKNW